MALNPLADNKKLNSPEDDVESFRSLCVLERPEQLKWFMERFVTKLGKDGVKECQRISKEYDGKVGKNKEFAVVSTEFTDFIKAQAIEFPSMKQRKEAFKDLDIDGNAHISLIEILIYINKDMVLSCSEERWGTKPPATGEEYTKAVLRELFMPAMGVEKSLDGVLISYVLGKEQKLAKIKELEESKEGLSGVKAMNVNQQIKKIEGEMEQDSINFDRDIPKAQRVVAKSQKSLEAIEKEIEDEIVEAEKGGRGHVNKGKFEGK